MSSISKTHRFRLFFKFLSSGSIAAVVNLVTRFFLSTVVPFSAAVVVAYLLGMLVAFWLFATAVFKETNVQRRTSLWRFALVNLLGLIQTTLISSLLIHVIDFGSQNIDELVSHLGGMSVAIATSFIAHKNYTFSARQV